MKQCELVGDMFSAVHDGAANEAALAEFQEHLRRCSDCRDDYRWYGLTLQALSQIEDVSPPEDFLQQLNHRIDSIEEPYEASIRDRIRDMLRFAPAMPVPVGAMALAVIAVVGFMVYNQAIESMTPAGTSHTVAAVSDPAPLSPTNTASSSDTRIAHQLQANSKGAPFSASTSRSMPEADERLADGSSGRETIVTETPESSLVSDTDMRIASGEMPMLESDPGFKLMKPRVIAGGSSVSTLDVPRVRESNVVPMTYFTPLDPTDVEAIGGSNLTVESRSLDEAVRSFKQVLQHLQGRLVNEQIRVGNGSRVFEVAIPSAAWPDLTTELVKHGAVEVGAGNGVTRPRRVEKTGDQVLINIRFTRAP